MIVFIIIGVKGGTARTVGNRLLEFKEIKNIHIVKGNWDLIIKVEVKNIEDLQKFIYQKMRPIKEILRTETFITTPENI